MGLPAAKENDFVQGLDVHIVMVPSPGGPVPTPLPHVFYGKLDTGLSSDVFIDNRKAATQGSQATNLPVHLPTPPGTTFQRPAQNSATIELGSFTVKINGKPAARVTDPATSCNDLGMKMNAVVIVPVATVMIGNGGPDAAALAMPWA